MKHFPNIGKTIAVALCILQIALTACSNTPTESKATSSSVTTSELPKTNTNSHFIMPVKSNMAFPTRITIGDATITELIVYPDPLLVGQKALIRVGGNGNLTAMQWSGENIEQSNEANVVGLRYTAPNQANKYSVLLTVTYQNETKSLEIPITVEDNPLPVTLTYNTPMPATANSTAPATVAVVVTESPNVVGTNTPPPVTPPTIEKPISTPIHITPTATALTLQPAVILDDKATEQDRNVNGDSFRLLRWRPWTGEGAQGWYYIVRFLPASDANSVYYTVKVPQNEAYIGTGDNVGWLTHSFDIGKLPRDIRSCYPYWDVIVAINADQVDCPAGQLDWQGVCRLSAFPLNQQSLATSHPEVTCGGSSGGSRNGSDPSSGGGGFNPP